MRAPASGPKEPDPAPRWFLVHAGAVAAAGAIAERGALGTFFSQDDFAGLARASGLAPRLTGAWRWLSQQVFWDAMRPLAGVQPFAYHLASLAVHATGAVLLLVWLRRRVSPAAALAGAAFFAAHPALFTAVHWISAIGDPLALSLGISALLLAERSDAARWLALPAFSAALLAKESAVTLPVVALLASRAGAPSRGTGDVAAADSRSARLEPGPRPGRGVRDPLWLALVALAAAYLVYFVATDAMGAGAGSAGAAYAFGFGSHLVTNALTYLGWTVDFAFPAVRAFSDARDPLVFGWALAATALALAALAWGRLRRSGFGAAALAYVALLLPVLPLRSHTYHYYLELPLIGAAWALALAFDAALPSRTRRSPAAPVPAALPALAAWAMVLLFAWNGALLARRCETASLGRLGLLADPVMDRARIAGNVRDAIAAASPAPGTRLAVWLPDGWAFPGGAPPGAGTRSEPYARRNLRIALLDGLAVRVLFPQVIEARVVGRHEPLSPDWRWALCRPDGRLRVLGAAELDSLLARHGEPR